MGSFYNKINNFMKHLSEKLSKDEFDKINNIVTDEMAAPLKIAIVGKTGVGKTTTINSLFNVEWHTSETTTGTIKAQTETFDISDKLKLTITDMPGLGDSIKKDKKFIEIYKEVLPDVDVILYIIQADDKGLGEDEYIIKEIISKCKNDIHKKFVIGINKVDLLGENKGLEWDDYSNLPSEEQEYYIKKKCEEVSKSLSEIKHIKKDAIMYFSAIKYYNLYYVLETLVKHCKVGWKFSEITPKNPLDKADLKFRQLVEEAEKEKNSQEKINK